MKITHWTCTWDLKRVKREIRTLSAAANSLPTEMPAASHSKTSRQQILPKLTVAVSTSRAPALGLAGLLPQTSKPQDLRDALLGLHWPADLIHWVDTGQQPMDSHTWPTDSCKSWALLQELLSLQLFQRKYLSLWKFSPLKKPCGGDGEFWSISVNSVCERGDKCVCVFRRVMLSLLHHPVF